MGPCLGAQTRRMCMLQSRFSAFHNFIIVVLNLRLSTLWCLLLLQGVREFSGKFLKTILNFMSLLLKNQTLIMLSANLGAEGGKERKLWKFGNQNFINPFFWRVRCGTVFYVLIAVVLTQTYMCVKIHRPVHQRKKVNVIVLQF